MAYFYLFLQLLFIQHLTSVWSLPSFRDKIPNGEYVPNPCKSNHIWKGVGHENPLGSGIKNPFGIDFAREKSWTQELCLKDSDGDGRTNGEELGDPKCEWNEGDVPRELLGITHPGVCDPWNSPQCNDRNTWVTCENDEFVCDAINEADTKNMTIRFPDMTVPNTNTNYYCMMFELPSDEDYHLVATTPYLDNEEVVHHMVIFGCDESVQPINNFPLNNPMPCGMALHPQCTVVLSGWTVGSTGTCLHPNVGIPIGTTGFRKAVIQVHWNNPMLRTGYKDSSGLNLFFTTKTREQNGLTMIVGQQFLVIPPGKEKVQQEGICHSRCTSRILRGNVHIAQAYNHMHYLGREMYIEHYRNGELLNVITNDTSYSYDKPFLYSLKNAIEIHPGDEMKSKCIYRSTGKAKTTFQGDSTSDEMCYGLLTVYPAENVSFSECVSWKSIPLCSLVSEDQIDGCMFKNFMNETHPETIELHKEVTKRCRPSPLCLTECKDYVKTIKNDMACLKNDIGHYIRSHYKKYGKGDLLGELFAAVDSCDVEIERDRFLGQSTTTTTTQHQCDVGAASFLSTSFAVVVAVVVMGLFGK